MTAVVLEHTARLRLGRKELHGHGALVVRLQGRAAAAVCAAREAASGHRRTGDVERAVAGVGHRERL